MSNEKMGTKVNETLLNSHSPHYLRFEKQFSIDNVFVKSISVLFDYSSYKM